MNMNSMSRRDMLALSALAFVPLDLLSDLARAAPASNSNAMQTLDRFIAGYCAAMNAPGLTLGLANAEGPIRVASYGYVDLAAQVPVTTSHLFEIGSITKSFVGLTILQLHEEKKVDLQAPIRNYLPWLAMETNFGEILVHHLLTHSSGMPDDAPLIPISPERRPRQALKPGSEFHYSNWGYDALGRLIEEVDGRPWQAAVTARILQPVGMRDTSPTITSASRPRIAQSYMPLHDDRPYPRHGALVPAGNLSVEFAAGSIASTPKDMSLYMQMILNHGQVQGGRVISEDSFKLVFNAAHTGTGIWPNRRLRLWNRRRQTGWSPPSETYRRHGVVHVGDPHGSRCQDGRLCFHQCATGLSAESSCGTGIAIVARGKRTRQAAGHAGV